jgi:hypothetical protein
MSMSEPLLPKPNEHDDAPAAAEPGPGAPGVPLTEEPDVLPAEGEPDAEEGDIGEVDLDDPPFRTPEPGDRLSADELDDRA